MIVIRYDAKQTVANKRNSVGQSMVGHSPSLLLRELQPLGDPPTHSIRSIEEDDGKDSYAATATKSHTGGQAPSLARNT